jgi:hypothetical protein
MLGTRRTIAGTGERAGNPRMQEDLVDAEQRWLHLAESYQFVEQAERFIADANARKCSADDPQ